MREEGAILISLGEGYLGTYLREHKISDGVFSIEYIPRGFFNILFKRKRIIRNVPESAIKKIVLSQDKESGIPRMYVFILTGEYGSEPEILKKIELGYLGDVTRLEEEKKLAKLERGVYITERKRLSRGHKEKLKEIKEAQDVISKEREHKNPFLRKREF